MMVQILLVSFSMFKAKASTIFRSILLSLLTLSVSCSSTSSEPPGTFLTSDLNRENSSKHTVQDMKILSDGNNDFAFDLYREVSGSKENLFFSPYSISTALSMLYGGAKGNTERQMAETFHFDLSQEKLHSAFNQLARALDSRGQGAAGSDGGEFRLNILNSIWGTKGYDFESSYLDLLALHYGAGLHVLDFNNEADLSRQQINDWVQEKTEDRIKELLPPRTITSNTVFVLTNAVYFNAAWALPFNVEETQEDVFHTLAGGEKTVSTMHGFIETRAMQGEGYQAVELPYDGNELSMIVIAPDKNSYEGINSTIDGEWVRKLLGKLAPMSVNFSIPKWQNETNLPLTKRLQSMGMSDAFSGKADFSGISGQGGIQITDVLHKGFVQVTEAGTEAAAATAVISGRASAPTETMVVNVNRAFIYFILDKESQTILFVGRVTSPEA